MKSLVFPIAFCIAISATAVAPEAQGGVRDGSHWSGGGVDIAVDVGYTSNESIVSVQAISASGWSNITSGTVGDNHSDEQASCEDSGTMTVPIEGGTMTVCCDNGQMKRLHNGKWIPMRRNFRLDILGRPRDEGNGPGEEVVTLPFLANGEISFEDWRAMTFQAAMWRTARRN